MIGTFQDRVLTELLASLGQVKISYKVPGQMGHPEVRPVDICFTPVVSLTDLQALGLLGAIASKPCLLELFWNPLEDEDNNKVLNLLSSLFSLFKHLQSQEECEESILSPELEPEPEPEPEFCLWILAPNFSQKLLDGFRAELDESGYWPEGVYLFAKAMRTGLIAINQLPHTPETIALRILGRGATQKQAIAELLALPEEHPLLHRVRQNVVLQSLFNQVVRSPF